MRPSMLIGALILCAACDTNLVNNPSFDRWCGESLCDWELEQGRVERVGSWHEKDYAVSFIETPTRISQVVKVSAGDCIRFDMIADVDPKAELSIGVDFDNDGEVDEEEAVPAADWNLTSIILRAKRPYSQIRYVLTKRGEGRAVLAQLWAESEWGCSPVETRGDAE